MNDFDFMCRYMVYRTLADVGYELLTPEQSSQVDKAAVFIVQQHGLTEVLSWFDYSEMVH